MSCGMMRETVLSWAQQATFRLYVTIRHHTSPYVTIRHHDGERYCFVGWVCFLISLGSPHVRPMWGLSTCGEPNGIELTAAHEFFNGSPRYKSGAISPKINHLLAMFDSLRGICADFHDLFVRENA